MFCGNCGTENMDGALFCKNCGTPLEREPHALQNMELVREKTSYPDEYKPIGMWGYFGYHLLFSIPLIGFIFILVFSFGGTQNKNLKNLARSYFCILILTIVLVLVIGIGGGLFAALSFM